MISLQHKFKQSFEIHSLEETKKLATTLSKFTFSGVSIGFIGQLGVGKTEFIRHLVKEKGVEEQISSPTFVLEQEYFAKSLGRENVVVSHWDLYRVSDEGVFEEISHIINDGSSILLIEWVDRLPNLFDRLSYIVEIKNPDFSESSREVVIYSKENLEL